MDIGALLKEKRIEKGLTQKDVAAAVGVSEGTVSRWESGKIENMRRDKINALANYLSIDPIIITKGHILRLNRKSILKLCLKVNPYAE
jgi:transcriptional regulator with XRE-family HTH domain